jgi:hypothetical protein
LRELDVHFSLDLSQLVQADAPVYKEPAVRANRYKVSNSLGDRLVIRHAARREFRAATANAVDFSGPAGLFVFLAPSLKE